MSRKTIAVWFSCGAASAVAAQKTVELYGDTHRIRVLNNPVAEEDSDNIRFLRDVENWIGVEIESVINSNYPSCSAVEVWAKRKYMSGVAGAPCTLELKKRARQEWERSNTAHYHVLGFTSEEKHRHDRFIRSEPINVMPVLIDLGLTKRDCFDVVRSAGIDLPTIYKMGYPNANCIGCVKSTSVTYWNHVREVHPDVFQKRAVQSREIGAKLVRYKGERIYLDELDPKARGGNMKNLNFECGLFCDDARELEVAK